MRLFISWVDQTGSKRTTRITLSNCSSTTNLINTVCQHLNISKNNTILRLKYPNCNLRIVEQWPISIYPIRNGSVLVIQSIKNSFMDPQSKQCSQPLTQICQQNDQYLTDRQSLGQSSFVSNKDQREGQHLDDSLNRLLEEVSKGNLDQIAIILKEEPIVEDQKFMAKALERRSHLLVNQLGDQGQNALHLATTSSKVDIVSFLLIKGSNPSILTLDQHSPLQLAIEAQSLQIIKILIEHKSTDINQVTVWGTALTLAIMFQFVEAVKLLLQHNVDFMTINSQGVKPIDICINRQIRQLLLKKKKIMQKQIPPIVKGKIFLVSSHMHRHRQKTLIFNPFKQEIIIEGAEDELKAQIKYSLLKVCKIERIVEKNWLMNQECFYFSISLEHQDNLQLLVAVRHKRIYQKWLQRIDLILQFIQSMNLNKPVPKSEQVIEILDDIKNQVSLHKRKIEIPVSRHFKNESILNLPYEGKTKQPEYFQINTASPRDSVPYSQLGYRRQDMNFKDSQLILGSILHENSNSTTKSPGSDYECPQSMEEEENYEQILCKSLLKPQRISTSKFRKQSQKIQIVSQFKTEEKPKIAITAHDFDVVKLLGTGSFGQVYLSKYKKTGISYALKVLNKRRLIAKKQLKYAISEANILKKLESPFVITLHYAFETPLNLYMAIDNCSNGDLSEVIIVKQKLLESTARFVIAQVILAVQHLHSKGILYRDLKPENILISSDGYIKLTDFGLSKENCFAMSFCGSPAYLSPQMLDKKGVGFESDLYGIGTVLFEMVVGEPPYFDEDLDVMFENIKTSKLRYPSNLSIEVKSLIGKLLERDFSKRIGVKDINQIKKHDFFKKLSWSHLIRKKIKAPEQLFINEQDNDLFEQILLQKKEIINLEDSDYGQDSSLMNRVSNFTFARDPDSTKVLSPLRENISKRLY